MVGPVLGGMATGAINHTPYQGYSVLLVYKMRSNVREGPQGQDVPAKIT